MVFINKAIDQNHKKVPGNYYHKAIAHNIFQWYWHTRRFCESKKILVGIKARKILDVGCHDGRFTFEVSKLFPQAAIYGIDISSEAIRFAKSKYPTINFLVARAEKLPFPDNTFDLINCFEVLEHVKDPRQVIRAIYRVLKPGGTFIVLIPTDNLLFRIIWLLWTRFGPGRVWHNTHIQQFENQALEKILEKEGFKLLQRKNFLLGMLLFIQVKKQKL